MLGKCIQISTKFEAECRELTNPNDCLSFELCPFTISYMNYDCGVWECETPSTTDAPQDILPLTTNPIILQTTTTATMSSIPVKTTTLASLAPKSTFPIRIAPTKQTTQETVAKTIIPPNALTTLPFSSDTTTTDVGEEESFNVSGYLQLAKLIFLSSKIFLG